MTENLIPPKTLDKLDPNEVQIGDFISHGDKAGIITSISTETEDERSVYGAMMMGSCNETRIRLVSLSQVTYYGPALFQPFVLGSDKEVGRYLLFHADKFYPDGSVKDLVATAEDIDHFDSLIVEGFVPEDESYGAWYHVVDKTTMQIVKSGSGESPLLSLLSWFSYETKHRRN